MTDFNYKKYSLEKLEEWMHDVLSCEETSPHEIYSTIRKVVQDEYNYHKEQSQKCLGVLELLSGHRPINFNDLVGEDSFLKQDRDSNSPRENTVCDRDDPSQECKGAWNDFWEESLPWEETDQTKEYNLREAEYYNKRARLDAEYEAIKAAGGYEWTPNT